MGRPRSLHIVRYVLQIEGRTGRGRFEVSHAGVKSKVRSGGACAAMGAVAEQSSRRDGIHGVRPRVSAPFSATP